MTTATKTNTPTPWHYGRATSPHGSRPIYGPDGSLVADAGWIPMRSGGEMDANADLVVRAVNAHDALVDALVLIGETIASNHPGDWDDNVIKELEKTIGDALAMVDAIGGGK